MVSPDADDLGGSGNSESADTTHVQVCQHWHDVLIQ